MNRVPFTLPDVGLREVRGMVYVEDGFLILRIQNALMGLLDTETDVVKIEPSALETLYVRHGLFRDRLVLQPKRKELLDVVPGEHANTIALRVKRKNRLALLRLMAEYEHLRKSAQAAP